MQKRNIRLCYAIAFLQGLLFYAPVSTLYRQANGVGIFEITLIESLSLALSLALELPWGWLADRIGYKNTLVLCHLLYFLSKIIFWQADSFALFLAERLLLSAVLAGLSGCDTAYLFLSAGGTNCPPEETRRMFGLWESLNTAGLVLACVVFSVLIRDDYRLSALLSVFSYGAAFLLSLFLRDVPKEDNAPRPRARELAALLLKDRRFLLFLLGAALLAETDQTITVFLSQLQYLRSGIPPAAMGFCSVVLTLAGLAAARSHRLAARLGERRAVKWLFGMAGAACILLAAFAQPLLSVVLVAVLRAAQSLFLPLRSDLLNRRVSTANRATVLSAYSFAMNLAAVGTNLAFGRLAERSVVPALALGAVFCFCGLFFVLWGLQPPRKHDTISLQNPLRKTE